MTQHTQRIEGGFVTYSTVDAEFEFEGKITYMEVHRYCGPMFYTLDEKGIEVCISADDSPRYDPLWEVYNNWTKESKD